MKSIAPLLVMLLLATLVSAQSKPDLRFDGHMLGETAKIFFSNATMAESKKPTEEYCAGLLKDFDAMKRYDAAKTNINKKDFLLSDVGGCKDVMTALKGERVRIGARFASELGKGAASYLFAESW